MYKRYDKVEIIDQKHIDHGRYYNVDKVDGDRLYLSNPFGRKIQVSPNQVRIIPLSGE